MDYTELTPPRVLSLRYSLEDRLTSPGSTSGVVEDRLKSGLAGREGYQGGGGDHIRTALADLLLLCRDLNQTEERACRLRYGSAAGIMGYEAVRRLWAMREGDGEDITDLRATDPEGEPMLGWVRVRGRRARMPSHAEIAERMAAEGHRNADGDPMTAGAVERTLRDASAKVAWATRSRAAMAAWEARA